MEGSALFRDIETRSTVDLADVGVHVYAAHPKTEVLCVGYASDDGPVKIWHPGEPLPPEFVAARGATFVAHNAAFEMAIERCILKPRYGFPLAPIERQVCTMAQVLALALPGKLERVAKVLNLDHQKDVVGGRLMKQLARPRRARKDEDKNGVYFFDDADRMARNDIYCMTDVETTREIYQRLPQLTEAEQRVWQLDQSINDRGFHLDKELAEAACKIVAAAHPRINKELAEKTDGEVTAYTQVARLTEWLKQNTILDIDSLNKNSIEELLELELSDDVRRVLELRSLGAQAAAAKAEALLQRRCPDGRVRGAFVYHAAGTGRWSSRGAQVHNLKRSMTEDIERAVAVIGKGDLDYARSEYANPLSVIGDCIRAMIIAPSGHTLIGGDFSGVEARVTAWIAGEHRKLDVFRAYDEGRGPDPYIVAAAIIFNLDPVQLAADYKAGKPQARELRQIGKGSELAFGFQGGVNAYRRFLPSDSAALTQSEADHRKKHGTGRGWMDSINPDNVSCFTDAQVEQIKNAWRRAHPNIVRFWQNINSAAWKAVRNPGSIVSLGNNLQLTCDDTPMLRLMLPSGREITYPQIRMTRAFNFEGHIVEHERGFPCLLFRDAANGQWKDVKIYGGLLTENIVQGIARDLLAEGMQRVDKAGLAIVTHTHDECVIETPLRQAELVKARFTKLMKQAPEWAGGLPIAVNTWVNNRYTK